MKTDFLLQMAFLTKHFHKCFVQIQANIHKISTQACTAVAFWKEPKTNSQKPTKKKEKKAGSNKKGRPTTSRVIRTAC